LFMRLTVVIILASILFSCASPPLLPPDISIGKGLLLPFRIDSIRVIDHRPDTASEDMKLPVFTTKRKEWIVKPGLNNETKTNIISLINASSNPEGFPVIVTLFIEEGYYKVSGNATEVGEHTRFDCLLNFQLLESNSYYRSSASAFYDRVGIFNATENHVKDIYRITVRNSIYKALKQAETVFDN